MLCTRSIQRHPFRLLVNLCFRMLSHIFYLFIYSFIFPGGVLTSDANESGIFFLILKLMCPPFKIQNECRRSSEWLAFQVIFVPCIIWSGTMLVCSRLHSELLGACCTLLCLRGNFFVCLFCLQLDILCNEEILGKDHTLKFVVVTRWRFKVNIVSPL